MQNTWSWVYVPWISAIIFFFVGVAAIAVAVETRTADSYAFPVMFFLLGILFVVCAFLLPKTCLSVTKDKKILSKTTGPWIGFWTQTNDVSLSSVCRIILRWKYFRAGKAGGIKGTTHWLLLQYTDGKEFDLFPPNCLTPRAQKCGQSLADFLQVDFRVEGE